MSDVSDVSDVCDPAHVAGWYNLQDDLLYACVLDWLVYIFRTTDIIAAGNYLL